MEFTPGEMQEFLFSGNEYLVDREDDITERVKKAIEYFIDNGNWNHDFFFSYECQYQLCTLFAVPSLKIEKIRWILSELLNKEEG